MVDKISVLTNHDNAGMICPGGGYHFETRKRSAANCVSFPSQNVRSRSTAEYIDVDDAEYDSDNVII